jgi:hypothetical protein
MRLPLALIAVLIGFSQGSQASDSGVELMIRAQPEGAPLSQTRVYDFAHPAPEPQNIRNRILAANYTFTSCVPGADGNCSVAAEYRLTDPDGKTVLTRPKMIEWSKPPPADHKGYGNGQEFSFDDKDKPGDYRLAVTVFDEIAKTQLTSEHSLKLEGAPGDH